MVVICKFGVIDARESIQNRKCHTFKSDQLKIDVLYLLQIYLMYISLCYASYLSLKGSSLIISSTGQIAWFVDLNTTTPSVFRISEMLCSLRSRPSPEASLLYNSPSHISAIFPGWCNFLFIWRIDWYSVGPEYHKCVIVIHNYYMK